jgi:hypothetical protein
MWIRTASKISTSLLCVLLTVTVDVVERVQSKSIVGLFVGSVYGVCDRGHGRYRVVQTVMLRKAVQMDGPRMVPANLQCNT